MDPNAEGETKNHPQDENEDAQTKTKIKAKSINPNPTTNIILRYIIFRMPSRFDLRFSYWILAWYFLYILGAVKTSPKFAIIAVIIASVIMTAIFIYYKFAVFEIAVFVVIIFIMKGIPLWTLRTGTIKPHDIYAFAILFGIYEIYIYANGYTVRNQHELYFKDGRITTPALSYIHSMDGIQILDIIRV